MIRHLARRRPRRRSSLGVRPHDHRPRAEESRPRTQSRTRSDGRHLAANPKDQRTDRQGVGVGRDQEARRQGQRPRVHAPRVHRPARAASRPSRRFTTSNRTAARTSGSGSSTGCSTTKYIPKGPGGKPLTEVAGAEEGAHRLLRAVRQQLRGTVGRVAAHPQRRGRHLPRTVHRCGWKSNLDKNMSYREFVTALITATGKSNENGAVHFVFRHLGDPLMADQKGAAGRSGEGRQVRQRADHLARHPHVPRHPDAVHPVPRPPAGEGVGAARLLGRERVLPPDRQARPADRDGQEGHRGRGQRRRTDRHAARGTRDTIGVLRPARRSAQGRRSPPCSRTSRRRRTTRSPPRRSPPSAAPRTRPAGRCSPTGCSSTTTSRRRTSTGCGATCSAAGCTRSRPLTTSRATTKSFTRNCSRTWPNSSRSTTTTRRSSWSGSARATCTS